MINETDFNGLTLSVAMTESLALELETHLDKGDKQEDLAFAFWRPSQGATRYTAIMQEVLLPHSEERELHGNVAFTSRYAERVLQTVERGTGIAFLHSHVKPGWQGMSPDDIVAERDRLAAVVAGKTGLPLIGMTRGTDGAWSARYWLRKGPHQYSQHPVLRVREIGQQLKIAFHPELEPIPCARESQVATVSVWGADKQADLARVHVGIVGLGSVGSIVAESLSRIGISRLTLIDFDHIEERNLDRTLGAVPDDAVHKRSKIEVSNRLIQSTHTAAEFSVELCDGDILSLSGLKKALDCDVIFSCVDRPWPRHMLNAIAYAHLIPVVDGGIIAKVDPQGKLLHADWRIHTVGPGRPCMVCLGALKREDISLDMQGVLDDPTYVAGLPQNTMLPKENVFPFSLSVAAHEVLQFAGLVTGMPRVGGTGAQMYHCYPGKMEVFPITTCVEGCEYVQLTATATDLTGNC